MSAGQTYAAQQVESPAAAAPPRALHAIRPRFKAPFISLEGGEGAGKSTQARLLTERLRSRGIDVQQVREPGSTDLGEKVREIIKRPNDNVPAADALLFMAARAQLMHEVILPSLKLGTAVVADRFSDSTVAYQGHAGRINPGRILHANELATSEGNQMPVQPDLTVLLDVDPRLGLRRRRLADGQLELDVRRFEELPLEFHYKVARGYAKIAESEPNRWATVDGSRSIQMVADEIWLQVSRFLPETR